MHLPSFGFQKENPKAHVFCLHVSAVTFDYFSGKYAALLLLAISM